MRVTVSPHEAVKNCVLVSHSLCILGHKHHQLSELDVLGSHVSCESPWVGAPRCGSKPPAPQGRAGSLSSLPAVCYCYGGRLMVALCPAIPTVSMLVFSFACCEGVMQLNSDFLHRIASYAAVDSVCLWQEASPGTSHVTFLN